MAMVNPMLNLNVKDSRWLTLEVCREFQRQKCTRPEVECKYAHPPPHVEITNGRVVCCFDSIKGKCQRREPPCKYLHPPQHLREQVIQNGRNNLILKSPPVPFMIAPGLHGQPMVPNMYPSVPQTQQPYIMHPNHMMAPYLSQSMQHPAMANANMMHANAAAAAAVGEQNHIIGTVPSPMPSVATSPITVPSSTKLPRADRLEQTIVTSISSNGSGETSQSGQWVGSNLEYTTAPLPNVASSQYSPLYFQGMSAMPGMVPMIKRQAIADTKSGIPMYQPSPSAISPSAIAYQQALQAMQMQHNPYAQAGSIAGHPPGVPRF